MEVRNYEIYQSLLSQFTVSSIFFSMSKATRFRFMLRPIYFRLYYRKQVSQALQELNSIKRTNLCNQINHFSYYFSQVYYPTFAAFYYCFRSMYFQHIFYILSLNNYMEVTTKNFAQALKIFEKILPNTEYISFDLEFTGLRFQKFEKDHINYLPYEKYKKLKYVAETYQVLQLGISLVVFQGKLKVYPFNFYLFPRNPIFYDKMLCMQLGCVKFMVDHAMDWNKWIREGINYIQLSEMEQCERNSKSLKALLQNLSHDNEIVAHSFLKQVDRIAKNQVKSSVRFPITHSSVFKLLSNIFYKYLQEKEADVSIECLPSKAEEEQNVIVITKITKKERQQQKEKRQLQIYGFAILFQQIWASKKPIVGHNCFLDLLYLYNSFVRPLPDNYFEFKDLLQSSGNTFFDTKYIASKYPDIFGTDTRLQDLAKFIKQKYTNKLTILGQQNQFSRYDLDKPALHEAGFDSYITAWVFVQMQKLKDDIGECKNHINLNFSFFIVNLGRNEDEIDQYYASNMIRINVNMEMNEDVKQKRGEVVKKIKEQLSEMEYKDYRIHEGYRQIFIEIKDKKREILKSLARLKGKKVFTDIKTFAGYLQWQEERVRKTALTQQKTRGKQDTKFYKKNYKEDSVSESSQKSEYKRENKGYFDKNKGYFDKKK